MPLNDIDEPKEPSEDQQPMESSGPSENEKLRESLNHVILAQQTSLEILTNLCCDQDSNLSAENSDIDDDDESINDGIEENDMNGQNGDNMDFENVSNLSPVVLEAIKAGQLLSKVLNKAVLPAENVLEILKGGLGKKNDGLMVLQMVQTLQSKAFLCLHNLFEALTIDDLGGNEAIFEVWKNLGTLSLAKEATEQVRESYIFVSFLFLQFIPSGAQRGRAKLECRAECSESEIVRKTLPHLC